MLLAFHQPMIALAEMNFGRSTRLLLALLALTPVAHAAEHITLRNGFELDCVRREINGDKVRIYMTANPASFLEVAVESILTTEPIADRASTVLAPPQAAAPQLRDLLLHAGTAHRIDADLLASVVQAESGGHVRAVSRTGARGLMQLMPATAAHLGVTDSFEPAQNIAGGSTYLDQLLTRYHDDIALALAAYNAGPGAVDRFHGVPPFRETRLYVARVINEFNRRKRAALLVATVTQP